MLRDLSNNGFASIVEVIVTSIIFVIAAAGIMSTLSILKPQETVSTEKMEAAYIGKAIIDDLRQQVDANTWYGGGGGLDVGSYSLTNGIYSIDYQISEPSPLYRKLTMNITW